MSFLAAFYDALHQAGCAYSGHINFETQRYHAFNTTNVCRNKCCRYRIFENEVGAHITCWRRDINVFWFYKDYKTLTIEEKSRYNKERSDQRELQQKTREEAIILVKRAWWLSEDVNLNHPYILRKNIIPYEARDFKDSILLPTYNFKDEIQSYQQIFNDGFKKFARGAPFGGTFLALGKTLTPTVLICEGWATGCSLHEVTGLTVIISFSASNMAAIAPFLKTRLARHNIIYCADKDKHEVGQNYAIKAAGITGGIVILPQFELEDNDLTDFNDVAVKYGKEALKLQLTIG